MLVERLRCRRHARGSDWRSARGSVVSLGRLQAGAPEDGKEVVMVRAPESAYRPEQGERASRLQDNRVRDRIGGTTFHCIGSAESERKRS